MSLGETCTQCWVGALQLHEGMLVCDVCGSIHQGFAEETQEYQTGISDARFFKKSEGMKGVGAAKAVAEEPPPPPPVGDALRAYVRALQGLLRRQADALVAAAGCDPALLGVLRELWLAHLAHSRLLEPAMIERLEALAEAGSAGASDDGGDSDGEAGAAAAGEEPAGPRFASGKPIPSQMTHERRSARLLHELAPLLRPQHTLFLLLLACWRQQEAVSPLDLARWALDGRLPYLSLPAEEGAALAQYRTIIGHQLTTPTGVPSPNYLLQQAAELAGRLGLACPPLSAALWLERYCAELELPQELVPVALQLHQLYQPAPLAPAAPDARPTHHPWARVLASLVLAVKLCYSLDGGGPRGVAGLPPPPAWPEWAAHQLERHGSLSAFPLSLAEAACLDAPGFRAYLRYLQQGLFASFKPPPDLETARALFQRLAAEGEGQGEGSGGGGAAAGQGAAGGGQGCAAGLGQQHQEEQQEQQQEQRAGPGQRQRGGGQQQQEQQQRQQQEQGAGPEQLPRASYLFYPSTYGFRKALFHPDYVALLAGSAPLAWLLPEALHEEQLLVGLERSMIGAECEVSYLYNAREQARTARLQEEAAWQRMRTEEQRRQKQRQAAGGSEPMEEG